jgi:CBS domain-containing protein
MLPAYPLDGGRVFRAAVWGVTGNMARSTTIAATVGQVFGWGLVAFGVYAIIFRGDLGGIWLAFIGWFLSNAASASKQETSLRENLKGVRVRDVMQPNPETVSSGVTVADLVRDYFFQRGRRAVAVTEDDRLAGIITLTNVKTVPQDRWPDTRIADIMTRSPLYSVGKDDELQSAFNVIAERDLNQVLVLEGGRVVGMLSRADILRYLHLSRELRFPAGLPPMRK